MKSKIILWIIALISILSLANAADLSDVDCGTALIESSVLTENIVCQGTGFFILDDDISLDCNGYSITYAEDGEGVGINVTDSENTTIRNCEIIEGDIGNNNYGIYIRYNEAPADPGRDLGYSVKLESNSITQSGLNSYDIGLFDADYVMLYNQSVGSYYVSHSKIRISDGIPNNWFDRNGLLIFQEEVTETGDSLYNDIEITNNNLVIDSNKLGFNKSAKIVFFGAEDYGGYPLGNCSGGHCEVDWLSYGGEECYNINQNVYVIETEHLISGGPGSSSYSIYSDDESCLVPQPYEGGIIVRCEDTLDKTLIPEWMPIEGTMRRYFEVLNGLSCDNQALDFDGLIDSVVSFEGNVYEFGSLSEGQDYGIRIMGINNDYNLSIKNFNIEQNSGEPSQTALILRIEEGEIPRDLKISDFQITTGFGKGIWVGGGENIEIFNGNVSVDNGTSILINKELVSSNNITLNNLTIMPSKCDLNVSESQVNLINQSILNYTFTDANITIINDYGKIRFNELITETGTGLSEEVVISNNYVYVNSIRSNGLNVGAEITLYDVDVGEGNLKILKDGLPCHNCGPMIQNGNDFTFTVAGFSNYTISGDMFCGDIIINDSVLDENMNCSGTGLIFGAENIFIDCQGHNIIYGNNGHDDVYGIHNPGFDNVTIRNCNISEGSALGENKHGIYLNSSLIPDEDYTDSISGEIIENNRVFTISDYSVPIKLFNVIQSDVENNTLVSDGHETGGIYISWVNGTDFINNTINSSVADGFGINVYQDGRNNYFRSNSIIQAELAITMDNPFDSGYILGNILDNNTLQNIYGDELELLSSIDDIHLLNQVIKEYDISEPCYFDIENNYGLIDFIGRINGTGENLFVDERIGDIRISQNEIYVNSSKSGLNKSAQLSFHNTGIYANARAVRDDLPCGSEYCSNITWDDDDYTFNVTGFTRYGISADGLCDDTITWSLNQTTNLVCDGNAWRIGADNIIIDCRGHNITYGNSTFGYGINNTGYENVTVKNCKFIEGYGEGNEKHALYYINAYGSEIINNTISTFISGSGIQIGNSSNSNIENNTIETNEDECYGIIADFIDNTNIKGNTISTYGNGYESTALKIDESSGINAENNILTTSGENAYGMHTYLVENSEIRNNDITTSDTGSITLYLESSDNTLLLNNTVEVANGASAIYIYGNSENNIVENNTVTQARRAVHLKGDYGDFPDNNTIRNNNFETVTQRDIVVEEGVTNLWLDNQDVERYYIEDSDVNIKNDYGVIDYLEDVSGTGDNFDFDVFVESNNLGASISGFDKEARLTIYNVIIQGTAEAKLDGAKCPANVCSALEIEGDNYTFEVTGFSNYSIGEMGINCGDTINSSAIMIYDLSCSGDGIKIGQDDVVFNCMGHSISYGSSGTGKGISINGKDDVIIKNCTIIDLIGGTDKYGIYSNSSENLAIINNSISTYSDESPAVYMLGSSGFNVSDSNLYSYFNHTEIFRIWNNSNNGFVEGNEISGNKTFDIRYSNNTIFIDLDTEEYNIIESNLVIEKTGIGRLEFTQSLNGNGTNFSNEVILEENFVEVNSSKIGLNKSAEIELYGLDFNGTVIAMRNGAECSNSICSEVNYNDGTYYFSVTGFTNYTLAGEKVVCGQTIYNTLHMNESMTCDGTAVHIGADNVEIDCRGYSIDYGNLNEGYAVDANGNMGLALKNCFINEGLEGGHAVYVEGYNSEIQSNDVKLSNENSSAIYINSSDNSYVWNNTLNSTDENTYIIYVSGSDNNEIINNTISESGRGIKIIGSDSNIIKGNDIQNVDYEEIYIINSDYNILRSNDFESYSIEGIIYFENNHSRIEYEEEINHSGSNLSSDIIVNFNFVEVNASVSEFNKSAYLIFNNLPEITGYAIPVRDKDGDFENEDWCSGNICTDFQKDGNNYSFHVSGFSNYSIYDMGLIGDWELTGQMILGSNVSLGHVIIGSDFASLDCRGYSVTYGADNQGIWNIGYDNVTIKNCRLERTDDGHGNVNAFYFENSTGSLIENNTFENYRFPQTDIVINKSNMTILSNQEARSYVLYESIINFQKDDGKIEYENPITQNGSNLSSDIRILYNSIYADSSKIGLSESADLSFYDLEIEGTAYAKRNGATCSGYCGPITHSGNDYYFSVTGFSTYSIGDNTSQPDEEENETSDDEAGANGVNFGGDYDAPEIGSPFPQGIIYETLPTLSVVTDEVATCKWDFKDRDYTRMDNEFQALGMIHTWSAVEKWGLGNYRIYARCMDANGNINGRSYSWTFEIAERTSECGNGICEYGEDENTCPSDCAVMLDESDKTEKGYNEETKEENKDLAGMAHAILELLKNTEIGSWMVYFIVLALFGAGYFITHHTTKMAFGDKKDSVKFNLDDLKPEISLSAKKIKYQLINDDIYNASLEYMNLKRLYMKIPSKYKEEKRYLYSYLIKVYEKIKKASEEKNQNN